EEGGVEASVFVGQAHRLPQISRQAMRLPYNSELDVRRWTLNTRLSMSHELEQLRDAALTEIAAAADEQTLEAARVRYLGRAGSISAWAERMKSLSKDEKPVVGKLLNEARTAVTAAIAAAAENLRAAKEA